MSEFFPGAGPSDIKIFFSYPRRNKERDRADGADRIHDLGDRLHRCLREERGINVFRDQEDMPFGKPFRNSLERAIRECDVGVVMLSILSKGANYVLDEMDALVRSNKFIGLWLGTGSIGDGLPLGVRSLHIPSFETWNGRRDSDEWSQLLANLRRMVERRAAGVALPKAAASAATFSDGKGMPELVLFPPLGKVWLGASPAEQKHAPNEGPEFMVELMRPLAMSVFPVSYDEWDAACKGGAPLEEPSIKRTAASCNVVGVSWLQAMRYVRWLNYQLGGALYRLPSEAEWEIAARAAQGEWRKDSAPDAAAALRGVLRQPVGDIWQWTSDLYAEIRVNPGLASPPGRGFFRAVRGGSAYSIPADRTVLARSGFHERYAADDIGFRVARDITD